MKKYIEEQLREAIVALQTEEILPVFELPEKIIVEQAKIAEADYSSNIALVLAKKAGKNPLELAEMIAGKLPVDRYQIEAERGYINFTFTLEALSKELQLLQEEGILIQALETKKINNEFISANPTGPLHIGNGRGGYFGDSLTRLLRMAGHQVTNEYYVNDGGEQIIKLGHSVLKTDEAVYGGEYIDELSEELKGVSADPKEIGQAAAEKILEHFIKKTCADEMGIIYDQWTSERELLESGQTQKAFEVLQERGYLYQEEGAWFIRTTDFGDDKDRVIKKSDGTWAYIAGDAGHILGYMEKRVEIILETFGADHHGYTKRFEAVARALGFEGEVRFTLMQLVKLEKDGQEVRMSKRAGNVVTIDELIEHVGKDVARFFFLMYSPDTHMTFDLGLAEERSQKNPVFYVQYAHARMQSILDKATAEGLAPGKINIRAGESDKEVDLARELAKLPDELLRATTDYAPHRLPQMAIQLAQQFHSFYASNQVINLDDREVSEERLTLVVVTQKVLAILLGLIGVEAPKKM